VSRPEKKRDQEEKRSMAAGGAEVRAARQDHSLPILTVEPLCAK
jgi:hypothetical protein